MTVIDEIKERVKIETLVSETATVRLRKSGGAYVGFCPFHHNTHTPSLVVFPATGTWKCFGSCNDGGTVIDWVIKQNPGWDVTEAVKFLARKAGVEHYERSDAGLSERVTAYRKENAKAVAMRVFRKWLLGETKDGKKVKDGDAAALAYAIDRGWSLGTIQAGGLIGFSGRATADEFHEMRETLKMHGVDPLSPEAVMILGFKGDVAKWAKEHDVDPAGLSENYIFGFMERPGLIYAHKFDGKIEYMSMRFLPGYDVERKSHNPSTALAGPRKPFLNNLYRKHAVEGKEKGTLIHIVEGQGDAVAWGQFGEPAMALCGASWRSLVESGVIEQLKNDYEAIAYTTDTDKPGEAVLTGKDHDFPLSTAFGAMLWVERTPAFVWVRPDEREKQIKDVNDVAQYLMDTNADEETRKQTVRDIISKAKPIVTLAASYVGGLEGNYKENAIRQIIRPLVVGMPNQARLNYSAELAEALYPTLGKTERMSLFNKWLTGELKAAKIEEDDDDDEMQTVTTFGGWYPTDKDENSGYLIDIFFDKNDKRIKFASVRITDVRNNQREPVQISKYLIVGETKYEPPEFDEIIESGVVKLASGLGPSQTSAQLIDRNARYYEKYFYLEGKSHYKFSGSYALFTWVNDAFVALNFLRARGGSGSGKSDLMYLIGLTCYRFAVTLSTSSAASYKGLAKMYKATVMIDEADNLMAKDDGTMEAFLKGRAMKRFANSLNMMEMMTQNGKVFVPSVSPVYGPTLITMYKSFKDAGIENRCMDFDLSQVDSITLDKAGMEPGYYPPELEDEAEEIRNMCLRWRLENWLPMIELTPEQRRQYKLMDPLVSPRVNQVLRPMKVLAVLQGDFKLLEDLKMIGRANYEDEMIKRAGSFEAMILRAALAADIAADVKLGLTPQASKTYAEKVKGYGDVVKVGKLGRHGTVRFILYKDLAKIANEIFDVENLGAGVEDKKGKDVKSKTVGDVCRDSFRMPVERTQDGWAVILTRERLDIAKLRLGLDREAEYVAGGDGLDTGLGTGEERPTRPTAEAVQADFTHPSEGAWYFNEETGEWEEGARV